MLPSAVPGRRQRRDPVDTLLPLEEERLQDADRLDGRRLAPAQVDVLRPQLAGHPERLLLLSGPEERTNTLTSGLERLERRELAPVADVVGQRDPAPGQHDRQGNEQDQL